MTTINKLSRIDTLANGDLVPVWATSKGDDRAAAMSVLLTYMQNNLTFPREGQTQAESPSTNNFTIQVASDTSWLLLTPTTGGLRGDVMLPAEPEDKDEVTISTTVGFDLNITSTTHSVPRPDATIAAHTGITMKYDGVGRAWYVVA